MPRIFKDIDIKEFDANFTSDYICLEFLANQKWKDGYSCRKCGHSNYCSGKSPFSRRCTRCKKEESATAHTMFHRCHIPLTDAFQIAYLVCNSPGISSYELSRKLEIRQMTCWKFKKKISECIDKSDEFTMAEKVDLKKRIIIFEKKK